MNKKLFYLPLCVIFTFALMVVYNGHTEKMWSKYDIDESPYAEVHGHADWYAQSKKTDVHVHCLGYAHSNRRGNYTLLAMVAEAEGEDWGREDYPADDYKQGSFEGGCYVLAEVTFDASEDDIFHADVIWSASATVQDETAGTIARDYEDHQSE